MGIKASVHSTINLLITQNSFHQTTSKTRFPSKLCSDSFRNCIKSRLHSQIFIPPTKGRVHNQLMIDLLDIAEAEIKI